MEAVTMLRIHSGEKQCRMSSDSSDVLSKEKCSVISHLDQ